MRFVIDQDARYRAPDVQAGVGRTIDLSSAGVRFTTRSPLPVGASTELSICWPVLLLDACPLKLVIHGKVIRSTGSEAVLAIDRYEFRTQGVPGPQPSLTRAMPRDRRRIRAVQPAPKEHMVDPDGRCHCGTCRTCLDNAKWDRVFNEKFADPDYYQALPLRNGSSLSSR